MGDIMSRCFQFFIIEVSRFVFSMFSGSRGENAVFRPFVFSNFSGLGGYAKDGRYVYVWVAQCWSFA